MSKTRNFLFHLSEFNARVELEQIYLFIDFNTYSYGAPDVTLKILFDDL